MRIVPSNVPFPPPWTVKEIPGGFKVIDAKGQSLAYCYGRETQADADIAKVLTMDNARRIAANIAKLPELLGAASELDLPEGGGFIAGASVSSYRLQ